MPTIGHTIALRPVDLDNYLQVLRLEVAPEQATFLGYGDSVRPNEFALAEAAYVPGFEPHAAYAGSEIVGLVVWGPFHDGYRFREPQVPGTWILDHVMIDRAHQGRGLARPVVGAALAAMWGIPGCRRIVLSYSPGHPSAERLYAGFGFQPCGVDVDGAPMMELTRP